MSLINENRIPKEANPLADKKRALVEKGIRQMEKAVEAEKPVPEKEETPAPKEEVSPAAPAYRPLIYLAYPSPGHSAPVWFWSLDSALRKQGYLTYCPQRPVREQFQQQDFSALDMLPPKVMASVCPLLALPEETLLSLSSIASVLEKSDHGLDNSAIVLTNLWFLIRSSLIIADLERPMLGAETAAELLYGKLLKIPSIGLLPGSGTLSPWSQHLSTLLFTDRMLANMLPIVQGYAPLSS